MAIVLNDIPPGVKRDIEMVVDDPKVVAYICLDTASNLDSWHKICEGLKELDMPIEPLWTSDFFVINAKLFWDKNPEVWKQWVKYWKISDQ